MKRRNKSGVSAFQNGANRSETRVSSPTPKEIADAVFFNLSSEGRFDGRATLDFGQGLSCHCHNQPIHEGFGGNVTQWKRVTLTQEPLDGHQPGAPLHIGQDQGVVIDLRATEDGTLARISTFRGDNGGLIVRDNKIFEPEESPKEAARSILETVACLGTTGARLGTTVDPDLTAMLSLCGRVSQESASGLEPFPITFG